VGGHSPQGAWFIQGWFTKVRETQEMREPVTNLLQCLWSDERGQDIAEYAVMLAVILVIVVGTIRLIGSNANNVFSQVGSAIQ
jgi:Flp pilus assembly pilin Flp